VIRRAFHLVASPSVGASYVPISPSGPDGPVPCRTGFVSKFAPLKRRSPPIFTPRCEFPWRSSPPLSGCFHGFKYKF